MRIKRLVDGQLRYIYSPYPGCECNFSLLSEVGQPWQAEAKALLDRMRERFDIEHGVNIEVRPWCSDFANEKGRT